MEILEWLLTKLQPVTQAAKFTFMQYSLMSEDESFCTGVSVLKNAGV